MVYSTIPQYDVYILMSEKKGLTCLMCSFGDFLEHHVFCESTEEMVGHLDAHRRVGDRMPEDIREKLLADDAVNFPKAQL